MIRKWDSEVDGDGPYTLDQQTLDLRDVLPEAGQFLIVITLKRESVGTGVVNINPYWLQAGDPYASSCGAPNMDMSQSRATGVFGISKIAKDVTPGAPSEFGVSFQRQDGEGGSWGLELLIIGAGP